MLVVYVLYIKVFVRPYEYVCLDYMLELGEHMCCGSISGEHLCVSSICVIHLGFRSPIRVRMSRVYARIRGAYVWR